MQLIHHLAFDIRIERSHHNLGIVLAQLGYQCVAIGGAAKCQECGSIRCQAFLDSVDRLVVDAEVLERGSYCADTSRTDDRQPDPAAKDRRTEQADAAADGSVLALLAVRLLYPDSSLVRALGRGHALGPLKLAELPELRSANAAERRSDEAARALKAAGATRRVIVLDERGKSLTSQAFAELVRRERDAGSEALALVIGGPDGHGEAMRSAAMLELSLGAMTMAHGLARVVLAEQLYRAATIIAGHPYHRV